MFESWGVVMRRVEWWGTTAIGVCLVVTLHLGAAGRLKIDLEVEATKDVVSSA